MENKPVYSQPPAHNHGLQPCDLISYEDMQFLFKYYVNCLSVDSSKDFAMEMLKKFSRQDTQRAAELFQMLRQAGFYPAGYSNDKIKWKILLKSKLQMEIEKKPEHYQKIGEKITNAGRFFNDLSMDRVDER